MLDAIYTFSIFLSYFLHFSFLFSSYFLHQLSIIMTADRELVDDISEEELVGFSREELVGFSRGAWHPSIRDLEVEK